MSDDDDYLSDKFLAGPPQESDSQRSYTQLRKEAIRKSQIKNEQNRTKSKRQRELEAREEGLNKSLFEKAQEDEQANTGASNKALALMMKMGFKPGQSLGKQSTGVSPAHGEDSETPDAVVAVPQTIGESTNKPPSPPQHKTEPLPINEWLGKSGIGTMKRARSPSAHERIAKMAKMEEEGTHRSFRDRARQEYEQRKAEGSLGISAYQKNQHNGLVQLLMRGQGKRNGICHFQLNVLWLNPHKPETFPSNLMEALALHHTQYLQDPKVDETIQERLRKQMQADALSTSPGRDEASEDGEDGIGIATSDKEKKKLVELNQEYEPDFLEEAVQFLRLQPQDRLYLVLSYLRTTYAYCFYCGTEYESQEEMTAQCPGPDEDDHD